jgi:hypothetical protein
LLSLCFPAFLVFGAVLVLFGASQADLAGSGLLASTLAVGFGVGAVAVGPLFDRSPRREMGHSSRLWHHVRGWALCPTPTRCPRAGLRRRRFGKAAARGLLGALLAIGCDATPDPVPGTEPTVPARAEIDRLRALGYLDFTEEHVEPEASPVADFDPARSQPGYNLFVSRNLARAELIDARGRVIRAWSHAGSSAWSNAELTDEGDLLVGGARGKNLHLLRLSWDGALVWKVRMPVHHDVEVMPDGRIATLTRHSRVIPAVDPARRTIDNGIAVLTPGGELLREASIHDMLRAAPEVFAFQRVAPARGRIDLLHSNSVEFMRHPHLEARDPIYAPGNAIVSIRHQDTIAIFDLEAEKVVWAWGQGIVSGPHDATVLENGNVLLFDNGIGRGWSRVIELDPLHREIVWQYRAPRPRDFFSLGRGSSQRLANGNTLIANSDSGKAFEVTRDGAVVWRFLNPNANAAGQRATITRIKRYPVDAIERLERERGHQGSAEQPAREGRRQGGGARSAEALRPTSQEVPPRAPEVARSATSSGRAKRRRPRSRYPPRDPRLVQEPATRHTEIEEGTRRVQWTSRQPASLAGLGKRRRP